MLDSRENDQFRLHSAAVLYRNYGWSVIPLRGDSDPNQPKVAAVEWSAFQNRLPTDAELRNWFLEKQYTGLGIVCGPVSSLAVLDFDDANCARAFARLCPDLTNTFTVLSANRRLPHYYFHVPEDVPVRTRRTAQADFQAYGTYVVGAPTRIADNRWSVHSNDEPRSLTVADVGRIQAFLKAYAYHAASKLEPAATAPFSAALERAEHQEQAVSPEYLYRYYRHIALRLGRNEALFRTASYARDCGWTKTAVLDALLDVHVVQPPHRSHKPETPEQRRQEGSRTIQSAFRYAARSRLISKQIRGLPNAIRESLLQRSQVAVARVLDGLLMAGVQAGARFTERAACELLRIVGIGRRTVQAALKMFAPAEEPIFEQVQAPPNPPNHIAHAADAGVKRRTKCSFVSGADRVKTLRDSLGGRPARQFRMPDTGRLYRLYGVSASGSDPLEAADLRSPEAYRCALQRALIKRRPGHYSRAWLAARLGISVWTCRRYDRRIGLDVQPHYQTRTVTWANLEDLPLEEAPVPPDGAFLETSDGKRYPPVRGLAARLLRQHQSVTLKRQHWNHYRIYYKYYDGALRQPLSEVQVQPKSVDGEIVHKSPEVQISAANMPEPTPMASLRENKPRSQFWLCPDCLKFHIQPERPQACSTCQQDQWQLIPETTWRDVEQCKVWWREVWHQHHAAQQTGSSTDATSVRRLTSPSRYALVGRVYQRLRDRTPDHALTHRAIQQLIDTYGSDAVERALEQVERRRQVHSAAGLLITTLRAQHGDKVVASETPVKETVDAHTTWLERLQQSPYAQYYANADYVLGVESGKR